MLEAKSWAQKDVSFHRCSIVFLSSSALSLSLIPSPPSSSFCAFSTQRGLALRRDGCGAGGGTPARGAGIKKASAESRQGVRGWSSAGHKGPGWGGGRHRSGAQRPRVGAAERPRGRGEGEGRGEVEGEVAGSPGPQRSTPQPDSWLRDGAAPAGRTGAWSPPASFQSCLPTLKQRVAGSPYPPAPRAACRQGASGSWAFSGPPKPCIQVSRRIPEPRASARGWPARRALPSGDPRFSLPEWGLVTGAAGATSGHLGAAGLGLAFCAPSRAWGTGMLPAGWLHSVWPSKLSL